MSIEQLDPRNRADLNRVVRLHLNGFPQQPEASIRQDVLRDFFYSKLVEDGLVRCSIGRADGRVVGFISYTRWPNAYLRLGVRRHLVYLARVITRDLVRRPGLGANLRWLTNWRNVPERARAARPKLDRATGEALFLAAQTDFQGWIPPGGQSRLTVRLFDSMKSYFLEQGMERIFLLVRGNNVASNLFCHSMGCRLERVEVRGSILHHYYYDLKRG